MSRNNLTKTDIHIYNIQTSAHSNTHYEANTLLRMVEYVGKSLIKSVPSYYKYLIFYFGKSCFWFWVQVCGFWFVV